MAKNNNIEVVVEQKEMVANVAILKLRSANEAPLPAFAAGAHVEVFLAEGLVRQYSLCGSPAEVDTYRLGVLRETDSRGGSKTIVDQVQVGQTLSISEPKNLFPLSGSPGLQVLVAGGIGITPILAMAYELRGAGRPFEVHYCFSKNETSAFIDELKTEFPDQLRLHCSAESKFDPALAFAEHPENQSLYTCGPNGFMTWVMDAARVQGFRDENIHFEQFNANVEISGDVFEVYCALSDQTIQIGAEESIATALINAGIPIDVSCEQGICGTCITDVLEGEPDHRDQFLTDEEKEDNDQMALCCSRAKTSRLVVDI